VFGLAFATVIFIILRVLGLLFMSLRTAKIAHNNVLKLVFQAPINTFFDITPIGKILNRFSKDIQVLDNSLCFNMGSFFACIYQTMAALIVATLAVRWILIAVFIVFFVGICLFKYALKGYKECNRIESVSKSPMLSFLQETQSGLSVIRAFKQQDQFKERNYMLVNKNTLANQISMGIWNWYSMRIDVITTFILAAACAFCVLYRTHTDPVLLALMLQYTLSLQGYTIWALY
jgi:ABC-type multidrug transport system fused ATPase/permease subunit